MVITLTTAESAAHPPSLQQAGSNPLCRIVGIPFLWPLDCRSSSKEYGMRVFRLDGRSHSPVGSISLILLGSIESWKPCSRAGQPEQRPLIVPLIRSSKTTHLLRSTCPENLGR